MTAITEDASGSTPRLLGKAFPSALPEGDQLMHRVRGKEPQCCAGSSSLCELTLSEPKNDILKGLCCSLQYGETDSTIWMVLERIPNF